VGSSSSGETIAALDIGTNSFHLVIAKPVVGGFEVVTRERQAVRIGHGGGEMKLLEPDAIERGIACLTRMQKIAESHNAQIRAVATSALREAKNQEEFVKRARKEAKIEIEVISGVEEARLIHLGALYAIGDHEHPMLLCDIGGGSTEIVLANDDDILLSRSFKLGAIRLTDRFFASELLHPSALSSCRSFVRSTLTILQAEVEEFGYDIAVASSGTAETIARLICAQSGKPAPLTFNRFEFGRTEIAATVKLLAETPTVVERQQRFKLDPGRADIILAGAIILEGIADVYGVKNFMFSDYALREGVLIDTLQRQGRGPKTEVLDAAMRSVRLLADRCDDRPDHAEHVARLACQLFDKLHKLLNINEPNRRLLEAAALLANVGVVISHSKHHLHSYYVIRNSELVGLSDREIEIIAQIARYHRKGSPKLEHPEFAALSADDQHIVSGLAGILRIAIGLDRTQDGRVNKLTVNSSDKELEIAMKTTNNQDSELNVYAANERKGLLSEVIGLRVKVILA
jgi:exopolyphosphatase/guanosine-5'-triphosphate,3'-diphosphate pyrophosphatase